MSDQVLLLPPEGPVRATGVWLFIRGPFWVGVLIVVLFFGVFGTWAAFSPLSSGAIATGIVNPDSSRQAIQHLEGGIVRTIHVREGQRVAEGDPLVTLEDTKAAAIFSASRDQYLRLLVIRARLDAHSQGKTKMFLPEEIAGNTDPDLAAFVANQQHLFETEARTQEQQAEIYARRIDQLESEIVAVKAEIDGLTTQKAFVDSDLTDVESLLEQQLVPRAQVSALRREQARIVAAIGSGEAQIARANQAIEEARLSVLRARESFLIEIADDATDINNQIVVMLQDMESDEDVLRRTVVVSPVDGVVLNLRARTVGGVVRPGDLIMEVVPVDDDMIIVAKLSPRDIELVHRGLEARVTLVPFASRNMLPLVGEVTDVGADSIYDEASRQYYYEIRVRVPASEMARHKDIYMSPGMPADVTVVTGARTMLQYLTEPLMRTIRNAFVYE